MEDLEYSLLKNRIYRLTNIVLNNYKSQRMRRRLEGFIKSYSLPVPTYCRMLEQKPEMMADFLDFITVNASEFFRDKTQFDNLQTKVFPELIRNSPTLYIWSAACSCGQETYSIAILLEEINPYNRHKILATDIDEGALTIARRGGPYPPDEIKNVGKHFLSRYFTEKKDGFWLSEKLKKKVEFRKQNLMSDPFERGLDLIICRNVIIYLSDEARDLLFQKFYRSLKENGVLFLGGSEVILQAATLGYGNFSPSFYRRLPIHKDKVFIGAGHKV